MWLGQTEICCKCKTHQIKSGFNSFKPLYSLCDIYSFKEEEFESQRSQIIIQGHVNRGRLYGKYYSHFSDETTEAWKSYVTLLR